jgi:hypothetical protein
LSVKATDASAAACSYPTTDNRQPATLFLDRSAHLRETLCVIYDRRILMRVFNWIAATAVLGAASLFSPQAGAAGKTDCEMHFSLTGWAAIYKHAEGEGTITCNNGKSFRVNIVAVGGGLTAGKYKVENATGKFSDVYDTSELFGSYAQGEANAGVVKSGIAQVLTKGNVSLALAGTGEGVNLGVSFGKFTIQRIK